MKIIFSFLTLSLISASAFAGPASAIGGAYKCVYTDEGIGRRHEIYVATKSSGLVLKQLPDRPEFRKARPEDTPEDIIVYRIVDGQSVFWATSNRVLGGKMTILTSENKNSRIFSAGNGVMLMQLEVTVNHESNPTATYVHVESNSRGFHRLLKQFIPCSEPVLN